MSNYEFAGNLYNTASQRNRAMCSAYLTADGNNSEDDILEFFSEATDEELAKDMLAYWPDDHLTVDDAAEIFAELRDEYLPEDEPQDG